MLAKRDYSWFIQNVGHSATFEGWATQPALTLPPAIQLEDQAAAQERLQKQLKDRVQKQHQELLQLQQQQQQQRSQRLQQQQQQLQQQQQQQQLQQQQTLSQLIAGDARSGDSTPTLVAVRFHFSAIFSRKDL